VTIHSSHPFATPGGDRDPVRRLRGALGGAVTLWTAGEGHDRAGLTVTSLLVAPGDQPRLLALLDPDSDLAEQLLATRRAVVQVLAWRHRDLAEMFAGTAPAPGGPFRQAAFVDTAYGPRLADAGTWAEVDLEGERTVGWSREVSCLAGRIVVGDEVPLVHRRGRFQPPADGPA
jgi:flavin reductase (DIM6/NTAB) family NADH-FMN oxidoreductase RutF